MTDVTRQPTMMEAMERAARLPICADSGSYRTCHNMGALVVAAREEYAHVPMTGPADLSVVTARTLIETAAVTKGCDACPARCAEVLVALVAFSESTRAPFAHPLPAAPETA